MLRAFVATAVVCVLGWWMAPNAGAAVIFFDDFESEVNELNASLNNWTVSDGTVDVVGAGGPFAGLCLGSPTPGRCVDMDGSSGNAGMITSNSAFNFVPGNYLFAFWAAGNQRDAPSDTMTVVIDGLVNGAVNFPSTASWQQIGFAFSVAAPTTASIVFNHAGGDNIGILIDNVRLESDVQPIPEPMSLTLLGSGLAAVAYKRKRARRAS